VAVLEIPLTNLATDQGLQAQIGEIVKIYANGFLTAEEARDEWRTVWSVDLVGWEDSK
jgi:hypothetical protein